MSNEKNKIEDLIIDEISEGKEAEYLSIEETNVVREKIVFLRNLSIVTAIVLCINLILEIVFTVSRLFDSHRAFYIIAMAILIIVQVVFMIFNYIKIVKVKKYLEEQDKK
jgi:uncharacterized membrane protein YcjF (UPF0283 family)